MGENIREIKKKKQIISKKNIPLSIFDRSNISGEKQTFKELFFVSEILLRSSTSEVVFDI